MTHIESMSVVTHTAKRLLSACLLVLAGAGWLASSAWAAADAANWPSGGRLVFDVLHGKDGIKLGEAQHRWNQDGQRYNMELQLETTGFAGLLYNLKYTQKSQGLITPQGLQPERFDVLQAGRAPDHAVFDWDSRQVTITRKGRAKTEPVDASDQDVLSIWHAAALLTPQGLPQQIALVSNSRRSPAKIEQRGSAQVKLPLGTVEAQHVRVRAVTGKLTIDLWVAESYHWVPVRMVMADDKGQVLDLQLARIELNQ